MKDSLTKCDQVVSHMENLLYTEKGASMGEAALELDDLVSE